MQTISRDANFTCQDQPGLGPYAKSKEHTHVCDHQPVFNLHGHHGKDLIPLPMSVVVYKALHNSLSPVQKGMHVQNNWFHRICRFTTRFILIIKSGS